ncbi:MAG TPA: YdbL family protein [Phenylobacterium sp.]|nr:YdbL family protein [Phenylobacterium sp.]
MRNNGIFPVVAAVVGTVIAGAAHADIAAAKAVVDAAKAEGVVGEQADGFLGFVKPGDAAVKAAVAEINAGRAEVYREAAARNGVTPEAAGGSAYVSVIAGKLKPGEYYKPNGGGWVRK